MTEGVNFTLFSAHAERVELCVFDAQGNEQRFDLPAARVISGTAGLLPAGRSALRLPYCWARRIRAGHRFNPAKLLLDPMLSSG